MSVTMIAFLSAAGFLAAAVDSIAGGGGLISLPAILAAGVPPHLALGTNKFASTCASLTSTVRFAFSKRIDFKLVLWQLPCTALGAALGVRTALALDERVLN
ncbi:MAG TPA: TSUP family transporter, partial [Spirochaetales bacterium]|nr:TSUP family transporter [Spirochaetales bacterium]